MGSILLYTTRKIPTVTNIATFNMSMRAVALRAPTNRAMGPLMSTLMVIYHLQQMHRVLMEVQELAEWVSAAEDIVHEEISCFGALPDPEVPDNRE